MKRHLPQLALLALLTAGGFAVASPAVASGGDDDTCDQGSTSSCDDDPNDDNGGHGGDDGPGDDSGGGGNGSDDSPGDDNGGTASGGGNGGGGGGNNAPRSRNGMFKFDQRSFEVVEGAGVARIAVERSRGERGAVSVQFQVTAGTATAPDDFRAVSGTLTWRAGDGLRKVFEVPLVDDGVAERSETVRLVLSNPTGGAILDPVRFQSLLRILDNDGKSACGGSDLCLDGGRFAVSIETPGGKPATAFATADDAGTFERAAGSPEWLVRVDDRCAAAGFVAVAVAEATTEPYAVTVVDTWTGVSKQYGRAPGAASAGRDATTFRCR